MESDKYLELSLEAKVLYVHLILKSDDEGVIINPVSSLRFMELERKYLDELMAKGMILYFEGLYIIAHWHRHNRIPPSKMNPSLYHAKLQKLVLTEELEYKPARTDGDLSNA